MLSSAVSMRFLPTNKANYTGNKASIPVLQVHYGFSSIRTPVCSSIPLLSWHTKNRSHAKKHQPNHYQQSAQNQQISQQPQQQNQQQPQPNQQQQTQQQQTQQQQNQPNQKPNNPQDATNVQADLQPKEQSPNPSQNSPSSVPTTSNKAESAIESTEEDEVEGLLLKDGWKQILEEQKKAELLTQLQTHEVIQKKLARVETQIYGAPRDANISPETKKKIESLRREHMTIMLEEDPFKKRRLKNSLQGYVKHLVETNEMAEAAFILFNVFVRDYQGDGSDLTFERIQRIELRGADEKIGYKIIRGPGAEDVETGLKALGETLFPMKRGMDQLAEVLLHLLPHLHMREGEICMKHLCSRWPAEDIRQLLRLIMEKKPITVHILPKDTPSSNRIIEDIHRRHTKRKANEYREDEDSLVDQWSTMQFASLVAASTLERSPDWLSEFLLLFIMDDMVSIIPGEKKAMLDLSFQGAAVQVIGKVIADNANLHDWNDEDISPILSQVCRKLPALIRQQYARPNFPPGIPPTSNVTITMELLDKEAMLVAEVISSVVYHMIEPGKSYDKNRVEHFVKITTMHWQDQYVMQILETIRNRLSKKWDPWKTFESWLPQFLRSK